MLFQGYTFDHSYWSFDGFHVDDKGVSVADSPTYASQVIIAGVAADVIAGGASGGVAGVVV